MAFFFSFFLLLSFFLRIIGISRRVWKERATDDPYPRAQRDYLYIRFAQRSFFEIISMD